MRRTPSGNTRPNKAPRTNANDAAASDAGTDGAGPSNAGGAGAGPSNAAGNPFRRSVPMDNATLLREVMLRGLPEVTSPGPVPAEADDKRSELDEIVVDTRGGTPARSGTVVTTNYDARALASNVLTARPAGGGDSILEARERLEAGRAVVARDNPRSVPSAPSSMLRVLGTTGISGRARYDPTRITVPGDVFDHRRTNPNRAQRAAPDRVEDYIGTNCFDSQRFAYVPVEQPCGAPRDKKGRAASYRARHGHWGWRGAFENAAVGPADMPCVRMWEEVDYQRRLDSLVAALRRREDEIGTGGGSLCGLSWELLACDRPFDNVYFLRDNYVQWLKDVDFEHRRRTDSRGRPGYFVGWHNHELDDIPADKRKDVYARVPESFVRDLEVSRLLQVPTPAVFAYYTRLAKYGTDSMKAAL